MKRTPDTTPGTLLDIVVIIMGILGLGLVLRACHADAAESASVTNDVTPPTMFTLTITAVSNGTVRVVTSDGSPLVVTQIVRTSSALSIALDRGLVFRRISGDLWQVTTEERAARSTITGGTP